MHLIEIGQQLRQLRCEAGYSQAQLAQLAGLARETVNRIEKGTYNDLGVKKLLTLFSLVGGALVVQKAVRQAPNFVSISTPLPATSNASRCRIRRFSPSWRPDCNCCWTMGNCGLRSRNAEPAMRAPE